jgi:aldehyde dehydrogenase (NAD+)
VESEVENKQVFDGEKASLLVRELRKNFDTGKTKSYEWRISQLEAIVKMLEEREKEIIDALHSDLSKPRLEAYITEVFNQFPLLFLLFISL